MEEKNKNSVFGVAKFEIQPPDQPWARHISLLFVKKIPFSS